MKEQQEEQKELREWRKPEFQRMSLNEALSDWTGAGQDNYSYS